MAIKRLSEAMTRKIAAGEVIDRPASVVKELIENAIDAKSETISLDIGGGGAGSIVVRDNGEGMDASDLRLSVERYATSKIQSEPDLDSIRTLGFRGEALASIAAVSRLRIVTRTHGASEATELTVAGGEGSTIGPASRRPGTTIEVNDLFFNLPARARFLGAPRTEFLHVNRTVQRFALVAPAISWALKHDARPVFAAPKTETLLDRLAQVYGTTVARALIPIEGRRDGLSVSGFVSRPDLKRGNRRDQLFVVNGRAIADRGLAYILASAYRGILRPGTYPIAVLQIDLPPETLDVNVHPRKEEVRFSNVRLVQDTLSAALQRALSSRHVVPSAVPASDTTDPGLRGGGASQVRSPAATAMPLDLRGGIDLTRFEREAEKVRVRGDRRVVGQLHSTYLLVETPDGLDIVDQHIAHERILYEQLREETAATGVARQLFLLPVRIELPFEMARILAGQLEALALLGVVIEEFGGGTFLVREYPQMIAEEQTRRGFQQLVESLVEVLSSGEDPESALYDRLLTAMACSAAIKAGERLPLPEAQSLVDRLMTLENPYTCPHGRPIIFALPREGLDRKFQRR